MKTLFVIFVTVAGELPARAGSLVDKSIPPAELKVAANRRFIVEAASEKPVFLLADTAWNLAALKADEIDRYLDSRASHGFNVIMFALNFAPQADEENAYGEPAYLGERKTELNPKYFEYCDAIIRKCADRGMYAMLYAMWAGKKSGTMNNYTKPELNKIGRALGSRYKGQANVILCAGGESTPRFVEADLAGELGAGLKAGCEGRNLVTIHPVSGTSTSRYFANAPWLDFYMSQGKSSSKEESVAFDAAKLVSGDFTLPSTKPTMMAEHRYEVGLSEDPLIQRRSLYQCVFAGGFGYGYGHNALWQMTPHTAQPWMLRSWKAGVENWSDALDTPAVRQFKHIKPLLGSRPFLTRMPDQSLVLSGQGKSVATRVQVVRDGAIGNDDATYIMAYLSAPAAIGINTKVIPSSKINAFWFNPATGTAEVLASDIINQGTFRLDKREGDGVLIIDDSGKGYLRP